MGECDALEIRDCEVYFVAIIRERTRTIIEAESELDEECPEFGWVCSIKGIRFPDFRMGTVSLTLYVPGQCSNGICQIVFHGMLRIVWIIMGVVGVIMGVIRTTIPKFIITITKIIISRDTVHGTLQVIIGGFVRVAHRGMCVLNAMPGVSCVVGNYTSSCLGRHVSNWRELRV